MTEDVEKEEVYYEDVKVYKNKIKPKPQKVKSVNKNQSRISSFFKKVWSSIVCISWISRKIYLMIINENRNRSNMLHRSLIIQASQNSLFTSIVVSSDQNPRGLEQLRLLTTRVLRNWSYWSVYYPRDLVQAAKRSQISKAVELLVAFHSQRLSFIGSVVLTTHTCLDQISYQTLYHRPRARNRPFSLIKREILPGAFRKKSVQDRIHHFSHSVTTKDVWSSQVGSKVGIRQSSLHFYLQLFYHMATSKQSWNLKIRFCFVSDKYSLVGYSRDATFC